MRGGGQLPPLPPPDRRLCVCVRMRVFVCMCSSEKPQRLMAITPPPPTDLRHWLNNTYYQWDQQPPPWSRPSCTDCRHLSRTALTASTCNHRQQNISQTSTYPSQYRIQSSVGRLKESERPACPVKYDGIQIMHIREVVRKNYSPRGNFIKVWNTRCWKPSVFWIFINYRGWIILLTTDRPMCIICFIKWF